MEKRWADPAGCVAPTQASGHPPMLPPIVKQAIEDPLGQRPKFGDKSITHVIPDPLVTLTPAQY